MRAKNEERRPAGNGTPSEKISRQASSSDHLQDSGSAHSPVAPLMRSAFAQAVVRGPGMATPRAGTAPVLDDDPPTEIVEIVAVRLDDLGDSRLGSAYGMIVRVDLGRRGLLPTDRLLRLREFVRGARRVELIGSGAAVRDAAGFLRAVMV